MSIDYEKVMEDLEDRGVRNHEDFNNSLLMVSAIVAGIKLASPSCSIYWMWYVLSLLGFSWIQYYFVKICIYYVDHSKKEDGKIRETLFLRIMVWIHINQWKFVTPVELGIISWFIFLCLKK